MMLPLKGVLERLSAHAGTWFAMRLVDGSSFCAGGGEPALTMVFRIEAALLAMATRGHIGLMDMYTYAYGDENTRTLEKAQRYKIDHVCRKIRRAPDERYVDIGSGFGSGIGGTPNLSDSREDRRNGADRRSAAGTT